MNVACVQIFTCGMLDMHVNKVKKDDNPKNKHVEKQLITDKHKKRNFKIYNLTQSDRFNNRKHSSKGTCRRENRKEIKRKFKDFVTGHCQRVQMYMFDVNPCSESQIPNASP